MKTVCISHRQADEWLADVRVLVEGVIPPGCRLGVLVVCVVLGGDVGSRWSFVCGGRDIGLVGVPGCLLGPCRLCDRPRWRSVCILAIGICGLLALVLALWSCAMPLCCRRAMPYWAVDAPPREQTRTGISSTPALLWVQPIGCVCLCGGLCVGRCVWGAWRSRCLRPRGLRGLAMCRRCGALGLWPMW